MAVLILDAQQRSALATTRSLGKRGIEVIVADHTPRTLAGSSRFAVQELLYPDPHTRATEFEDWIAEAVATRRISTVFPMTDLTTMILAPLRARQHVTIGCGPSDAYEQLSDKGQLVQLAQGLGIPIPRTQVLRDIVAARHYLATCEYPLVLKPARSKIRVGDRIVATTVFIAPDARSANEFIERAVWLPYAPCLAQEYIDGEGAGIFGLYAEGEPIAWFAHRRIREKPPSGGVSVLSESAIVDPTLRAYSEKLLSGVRWHGPAMVEYKLRADGRPFLMEVNCRFWGSLQLSIDSGIDFPWLWHEILNTNERVQRVEHYATGRRLRWVLGDLDNLLIRLRQPQSVKAKLAAIATFLGSSLDMSARQEIFRWSDPRPAFFELREWLRALT